MVVEKINVESWYAILVSHAHRHTHRDMNTGVALASAGISVGLASWGLARLTDNRNIRGSVSRRVLGERKG